MQNQDGDDHQGEGHQQGGGGGGGFDPEEKYEEFPHGAEIGFGPEQGFNEFKQLNDPELFTDQAKDHPVIKAFLAAPFSVTYVQFKSSTSEAEWFIHKPHLAMAGQLEDRGIVGQVEMFPDVEAARIGTYIINHELTLALRPVRAFVVEDGRQAGVMIYKGNGSKTTPFFGDGVEPED
jgi:hypothetical protein